MSTFLPYNEIAQLYRNGESIYTIATKYNTYPNKILRLLKKNGEPIRDRSEAQQNALKVNRAKHPTLGKQRTKKEKIAISEGMYQNWQKMSKQKRERIVKKRREKWNEMTDAQKANMQNAALLAVRKAAKEGSKMELFLRDELLNAGFDVSFHKKGLIIKEDMELDILIPSLKTVIEIDGPSHFYPIWGEENLMKHIKADAHKSGLLLSAGYVIIRIKHLVKAPSQKHMRDTLNAVVDLLNEIKQNFPDEDKRYIELEVD